MVRLILAIFLALLMVLPAHAQQAPYPASILADGPVGYWRLNMPGDAPDLSGRLNHGVYLGGLQSGVAGLTADGDAAVQLDGVDDYIAIPDSASLSPSAAVSVEAWIYLDQFPASTGKLYRIAGKANSYGLYLESQALGTMTLEFAVHHPGGGSRAEVSAPRTAIKLSQWQHLVGTYDGAVSRLYVDGIEVASLAHSGPIADTTTPLWLSGPLNNWSLPGKLDEVVVYPSALSQQQIDAHRAAAVQLPTTPTPTITATMTATATETAAPTDTPTPTDIPTLTATPADTLMPTAIETPNATATATDVGLPSGGVLCAGLAVGPNAVTVMCARDNTATPWPASWPLAPGTLSP